MGVPKKEKLLALGAAIYLLGLELEHSRETLGLLLEQGLSLTSWEIHNQNAAFNQLSLKFTKLEEQYLQLKEELLSDMP